ncbi:FUSC family protein [Microbacterium luticocti]|uniref:FUSC family protein n=1 Tax=Microbacterium luticocti TaxID=451764 RepID=UPI000423BD0E|nr:FUSC family protein [Microbacterium luticocti]
MDLVWITLGVALLLFTLVDMFLTVLNYDEAGLAAHGLIRGVWIGLRAFTRRVGRRWRPVVLRQVTGILLLVSIAWWVAGIVVGFTFVYLGLLDTPGAFARGTTVPHDFWGAFYISVGQFATVGVDGVSPGSVPVRLVMVFQALTSIALMSIIITFLWNVFGVIGSLRALVANFFTPGHGVGDPVDTLLPYFPDGAARGLDAHLGAILDALNAYDDGLAQNRSAYYFQSGRDQFSLPYAVSMTAGTIGALRWCVPGSADVTREPALVRLVQAFDAFRDHLQGELGWASPAVPDPVDADAFAAAAARFAAPGPTAVPTVGTDPWVVRFLTVQHRMGELLHAEPDGEAAAYDRYRAWLPFAYRAQAFLVAVSRDLDYQPIARDDAATALATPTPTMRTALRGPVRRLAGWLRRRSLFLDPGGQRLAGALTTLAAVAVAIGAALGLAPLIGANPAHVASFAAVVALFSAPVTHGVGGGPRWRGLIAAVPAAIGVLCGILLPRDPISSLLLLAVAAGLAVWVRRFGAWVGGLGQLAFVSYYFTLLLGLGAPHPPGALLAIGVGVVCSWLAGFIPGPSAGRRITAGISSLYERVAITLDTLIDLVSTGRQDRRLVRVLRAELGAIGRVIGALSADIDTADATDLSSARGFTLRVRVVDLQLAMETLAGLVPAAASISITVEHRARLAAELLEVQQHLRTLSGRDAPAAHAVPATQGWSSEARRVLVAIAELRAAADSLHRAQTADEAALAARHAAAGSPALTTASGAAASGAAGLGAAGSGAAGSGVAGSGVTGSGVAGSGAAADATGRAAASAHVGGHAADGHEQTPADAPTASAMPGDAAAGHETGSAGTASRGPVASTPRALGGYRQAVQAMLSTGLALWLGGFVSSSHQYWAAMPAFQVLSGSDGETRVKAWQRIGATIVGSAFAFGLAIYAGHEPAVALPLMVVSVFFMSYLRASSPAWTAFWMTLLLATLYDLLGTLTTETVQVRVVETAIGSIVAVLVSTLVLPTRTRARVLQGMAGIVARAREVAAASFAGLPGTTPDAAAEPPADTVAPVTDPGAAPVHRPDTAASAHRADTAASAHRADTAAPVDHPGTTAATPVHRADTVTPADHPSMAVPSTSDKADTPDGTPAPAASPPDLAAQERDLSQRLTALERLARPLRHNPGSLQSSGIEAQLAALWGLIGHGRQLVRALAALPADQRSGADWAAIQTATLENFDAALAVLGGGLPVRLHAAVVPPATPDAPRALQAVLVLVARVNQSLLALIDAVAPGTVAAMAGATPTPTRA